MTSSLRIARAQLSFDGHRSSDCGTTNAGTTNASTDDRSTDKQSTVAQATHKYSSMQWNERNDGAFTINCGDCVMQRTSACTDCVVSFVVLSDDERNFETSAVGSEPLIASARMISLAKSEYQTLLALQDAGLLPPTRHLASCLSGAR
jgi:hypothetical protein